MSIELLKDIDLTKVTTLEKAKELLTMLMNVVEIVIQENEKHAFQIQELKDEINRLKGEQGKPTFKPNKESERRGRGKDKNPRNKNNKQGGKKDKIERL